MKSTRSILTFLLFSVLIGAAGRAESVVAVPSPTHLDAKGGELILAVTIDYADAPGAVGLEIGLPEGWSFAGVVRGEQSPDIASPRGSTGKVEMAWTGAPQGGASFSLKLAYPAGATTESLFGTAMLRRSGKQLNLALTVPFEK